MTQEELKQALELHGKWLNDEEGGKRLDLSSADLRYADLRYANLRYADLRYADLRYANLRYANTINTRGIDVICVQLNTSDQNRQIQYYVQLKKATAGCFQGTLKELKTAVDKEHDKDSVIYKRYQIAFKTIEDILKTYGQD